GKILAPFCVIFYDPRQARITWHDKFRIAMGFSPNSQNPFFAGINNLDGSWQRIQSLATYRIP
ncbi:MAG: hypothetical protein K8H99_10045, partial [Nitrospirae bacterium]|nr:hypothetical protein [Fimbriimonadaceae bacterium]